jgi:hypothetical protein
MPEKDRQISDEHFGLFRYINIFGLSLGFGFVLVSIFIQSYKRVFNHSVFFEGILT